MKRTVIGFVAAVLTATGCLGPLGPGADERATQQPGRGQRPPIIHAEQVNETNAHAQALALEAEMAFDARHDPAAPTAKGPR